MIVPGRLCYITRQGNDEARVIALLEAGVRWVQYREKGLAKREFYRRAVRLRHITRGYGACLVINDHADVALAVSADGVHLGQEDLPLKEARRVIGRGTIGISTHCLQEALEAERGGADYVGFGPIFHTTTKDAGKPKGLEQLIEVVKTLEIPVVAIGGITEDNAAQVFRTGCRVVAVSSGLWKGDPVKTVRGFLKDLARA